VTFAFPGIRWSRILSFPALVVILASCGVTPRGPSAPVHEPMLSVDYVLAPPRGDSGLELEDLALARGPAASLRRAFLLLDRNLPAAAIDACAQVLYGAATPSTEGEALARYLRAEAFEALGEPARGAYDRQRARELALDPRIKERLERLSDDAPPAAPAAEPRAALGLVARSSWGPDAPIPSRMSPMGRIFRITVHHSAMLFRDDSQESAAAQLRVIQRNHMQDPTLHYGDIGYHFLIDPAGRVWEARDLRWQGAHARSDNNRGNIGVCLLGNFIRGGDGQRPPQRQLAALRDLLVVLADRYKVGGDQIYNHNDFVNTVCPGPYLQAEVRRIARELGSSRSRRGTVATRR